MALSRCLVLCVLMFCVYETVCFAEVYKVGDDAGWTPGVNFTHWAFPKHFRVGDVIVFTYNKTEDNVVRVMNRKNFHDCNTTGALMNLSTGNDTITIPKPGHYYFISSSSDHCMAHHMRVDIRVPLKPDPEDAWAPAPAPAGAGAPAPAKSSAAKQNVMFGMSVVGLVGLLFQLF